MGQRFKQYGIALYVIHMGSCNRVLLQDKLSYMENSEEYMMT